MLPYRQIVALYNYTANRSSGCQDLVQVWRIYPFGLTIVQPAKRLSYD
jgi:hypothetical protein